MSYIFFLYISCYIAEIWIAFLTVYIETRNVQCLDGRKEYIAKTHRPLHNNYCISQNGAMQSHLTVPHQLQFDAWSDNSPLDSSSHSTNVMLFCPYMKLTPTGKVQGFFDISFLTNHSLYYEAYPPTPHPPLVSRWIAELYSVLTMFGAVKQRPGPPSPPPPPPSLPPKKHFSYQQTPAGDMD